MSEITTLPDGWEEKPLGIICKIVSGGTPSRDEPSYWIDGDVPWVTPTDITGNAGRILYRAKECLTPKGLRASSAKMLPEGTLLMTSRATLGEMKIAAVEVCTNQGFKSLVTAQHVDNWYLYYQMNRLKAQYSRLGIGSTFLEVNKKDTESFTVPVAPLSEQRKIAKILCTVDNLIEKTQALIDKYQSIKQGMMHDLFTRGVDENGHLRPSYEEAPHLYKESELGWIPKEWEVFALEEKLEKIIDYRGKTPVKTESGVPLITAKNVRSGFIDEEPREYIAENSYDRWMTRGIPSAGDILFTTEAPLGNVARVPNYKLALAQRLLTLIPAEGELTQSFLYWLLLWEGTFIRLEQRSSGSTVLGIKQSVFRKMVFCFPLVGEQKAIAHSLDSVIRRVHSEQQSLRKYSVLKNGLMQDLLTGKVRVKVDA